jgi:hypothetical protein
MLDQILETTRKAAESSLQMQQAIFKQWAQNWLSTSPAAVGISADWGGTMRKRWFELTLETLNKQQEAVNAAYRGTIETLKQVLRASEAKSAEDFTRAIEEIWRKSFEGMKGHAEAQFQEFQTLLSQSFEWARKVEPTPAT